MKLRIYSTSTYGDPIDVHVFDAKVRRTLNGADEISFRVESDEAIDFPIGSMLSIHIGQNLQYYMNELPAYEKRSDTLHIYNLVFQAPVFDLQRVAFLDATGEGEFFFAGTAEDFIDLIIYNLNNATGQIPSDWQAGTTDVTEVKNLQFSNQNCWQALNIVCKEFDMEFYKGITGVTNTLALVDMVGSPSGKTLSVGKGNGLYNLKRTSIDTDQLITRLYYRGSNRNLPPGYAYERLRGTTSYLEQNVATYGRRDGFINFDEIMPKPAGAVGTFEITVDGEHLLVDTSFPFDLMEVISGDSTYLVPGTTAKMNFLTGDCAGYTFDIEDYDHDTHTFTLMKHTTENGYEVPNSTVQPGVGDEFVVYDIRMPEAVYLALAVTALDSAAEEYHGKRCTPRVTYAGDTDPKYVTDNSVFLDLGDQVTIDDIEMGVSETCRVTELEYPLFDTARQKVKITDVRFAIKTREQKIAAKQTEIAIQASGISKAEWILRNKKTVKEIQNRTYSLADQYFIPENNRPESLDPYMLALDSGEIQFSLQDVVLSANAGGDKTQVGITAGSIIHHSIAGKTRKEITKEGAGYDPTRTWTIAAATLTAATDNVGYFVYAKIPTATGETVAEIILDENHLWAKSIDNYILYKLGYLGKVESGARKLSVLWGMSAGNIPDLSPYALKSEQYFVNLLDTPYYYHDQHGIVADGDSLIWSPRFGSDLGFFWISKCCPDSNNYADLITNGEFNDGLTGWSGTTGWSVADGVCVHTPGNTTALYQALDDPNGGVKRFNISVVVNAGSIQCKLSAASSEVFTIDRTQVFEGYFNCEEGSWLLEITPTSDFDGSIDTITLNVIAVSDDYQIMGYLSDWTQSAFSVRYDRYSYYLGRSCDGAFGDNNIGIVTDGLSGLTTGEDITVLGALAGASVTEESNLILIGTNADIPAVGTSDWLNIGDVIQGDLDTGEVLIAGKLGFHAGTPANTVYFPVGAAVSGLVGKTFVMGSGGQLAWVDFPETLTDKWPTDTYGMHSYTGYCIGMGADSIIDALLYVYLNADADNVCAKFQNTGYTAVSINNYSMPVADGTTGQVISTNGAGVLGFVHAVLDSDFSSNGIMVRTGAGTYSSITNNSTNWDTAYGWGDHSAEGYLTSESDPVFTASAAAGIDSTDISNWDTAYGWGNHASSGYLTDAPSDGYTYGRKDGAWVNVAAGSCLWTTDTYGIHYDSNDNNVGIGDDSAALYRLQVIDNRTGDTYYATKIYRGAGTGKALVVESYAGAAIDVYSDANHGIVVETNAANFWAGLFWGGKGIIVEGGIYIGSDTTSPVEVIDSSRNASFAGLKVGALTYPAVDGSAGQTFVTNGAGALSFATITGLPASPANGDIVYYNSGWQKLAKGSDGTYLTLASGIPSWGALGTMAGKTYWNGTQAAYTALGSWDSNTIYFINE